MLGGAVPASAADPPKPLTSRRLFDQSRPSVQLITVQYSAGLVVPEPVVTQDSRRSLESIVADKIRRGEVPATQAAAQGAIIDEIARNPSRWLTASSNVSRTNIKLTTAGSGFSITPDGYIVTNAHVVAPKEEDLKAAFLLESLRKESGDSAADLGDGLTQSQATKLANAMVRWATAQATLANFKKKITVYGSSGSGSSSPSKSRTARLVDSGQQFPGKDVAVIKVQARNMATVPIGDDTTLNAGDRLFVLGFPGPATFDPVLSKDSQKEPTLTQGVLSAKKQVKGGFTILQTDAGMTHGNSGGPVLDEQGRVVGVATVGSVDPNTGREVAGLNFAVPASIVKDLLGHANVTATEGQATRLYREALDAFDKQWYKPTVPLFEQVKALDPGHPLVTKLLNDSRTAIREGRDRTPLEILGLPVLVFGSLAAVVVVGVVGGGTRLLVSRRRRRRRSRSGPTGPGTGWDSQPGGWPAQPSQAWGADAAEPWPPQPAQAWDPQPARAWDGQPTQAWDGQHAAAWDAQPGAAPAAAAPADPQRGMPPAPADPAPTRPLGTGTPAYAEQNGNWLQDLQSQQLAGPIAPAADGYDYSQRGGGSSRRRRGRQPAASNSWWAADGSQTQEIPVAGRAVPEPTPWDGAEQAPPTQPQWRRESGEPARPVEGEWNQPAQAPAREPEWGQPVRPSRQARLERDWSEPARPAVYTGTERAEPESSGASGRPHERYVQAQSASLVCWNCGRHNQSTLRYCEECWSVLS
jgi:serine protease Do